MKYYLDSNIKFIENNDGYINIYTPHAHKTLKVNSSVAQILQMIIDIGDGVSFDPDVILDSFNGQCSLSDLESVIGVFIKNNFLFTSKDDYLKSSPYSRTSSPKSVNLSTAYLHLTQRCNLNCAYCYNKQNLNSSKKELTLNQWKESIDKLKKEGVSRFILTGGEPLLRSDIVEIVKYIKSDDSVVSLLTNGTLLHTNPQLLDLVDTVTVSLDSLDTELNNSNRENSIKYSVVENLKSIPSIQRKKFTIRSVLTKDTLSSISSIKSYVEDELNMQHSTALFAPNNPGEISLIPDYSSYLNEIRGAELNEFSSGVVNCGSCSSEIALDSNGDIYPCQALIKEDLKVTSILEENWIDSFNNSKVTCEFSKINVHNIENCQSCDFKYICGGGCRAIAYNVYGDVNAHLQCYCDYLKKVSYLSLAKTMFKSS